MAIVHINKAKQTKKICRIGQSRQVVIPKNLYQMLELEPGDFVEMSVENGALRLRPKRLRDLDEEASEPFGTVRPYRSEPEIQSGDSRVWRPIRWMEA